MTRAKFLKNLIGLYGVASLPIDLVKQYQKVYLLQCFVRGFSYYDGPKMIAELNTSGLLEMVREPDNEYDECAIALHFNSRKIGFIPMESNEVLSVLLDTKLLKLQAEITHIEPDAQSWENVFVAIYALTEIENNAAKELLVPFTIAESPHYYTLKSPNNTYTQVLIDDNDEILDGDTFYQTLVDNSSDDSVYDLIHNSFEHDNELETAVNESRIVIQKNKIPSTINSIDLEAKVNNTTINIENTFKENGYIVANINKIATIPDKISSFIKILDKNGKQFFEVIFKN